MTQPLATALRPAVLVSSTTTLQEIARVVVMVLSLALEVSLPALPDTHWTPRTTFVTLVLQSFSIIIVQLLCAYHVQVAQTAATIQMEFFLFAVVILDIP